MSNMVPSLPPPPQLPPPPPRPRQKKRVRSRRFPKFPRILWMVIGLLLIGVAFWGLQQLELNGGNGSNESVVEGPRPTPAERPSLLRITPVVVGNPPLPPADTGQELEGDETNVSGEPEAGGIPDSYTVAPGDSLGAIASKFNVSMDELMELNQLSDPNVLSVGQVLLLPSKVQLQAPFQNLLPDSEAVLGPAYQNFDLETFVAQQEGYLAGYSEPVEGGSLAGVAIIERVSQRYSVGPRLLLALLEYQSGWLTQLEPNERAYPLGLRDPGRSGLFFQLSWAANRLNQGYYGKLTSRDIELRFQDNTRALYHPQTNAGTAALQNLFAINGTPDSWSIAMAEDGFIATYRHLFGEPWELAVEPLIPDDLKQPSLKLPWASGETWYFTGGPHGGWGDRSGWASLDFVPSDLTGCQSSSYWATAAAKGKIIRSEYGEVVLDLDGDGFVGTGWSLLYMHMAEAGRVGWGQEVEAGEPIGRPSCEGGISNAAHLHLARRYNGQWMDISLEPYFKMDGWEAQPSDKPYNGLLVRGDEVREACECRRVELNGLVAP